MSIPRFFHRRQTAGGVAQARPEKFHFLLRRFPPPGSSRRENRHLDITRWCWIAYAATAAGKIVRTDKTARHGRSHGAMNLITGNSAALFSIPVGCRTCILPAPPLSWFPSAYYRQHTIVLPDGDNQWVSAKNNQGPSHGHPILDAWKTLVSPWSSKDTETRGLGWAGTDLIADRLYWERADHNAA